MSTSEFSCPNCGEGSFPDVVGEVTCGECGVLIQTIPAVTGRVTAEETIREARERLEAWSAEMHLGVRDHRPYNNPGELRADLRLLLADRDLLVKERDEAVAREAELRERIERLIEDAMLSTLDPLAGWVPVDFLEDALADGTEAKP